MAAKRLASPSSVFGGKNSNENGGSSLSWIIRSMRMVEAVA